MLRPVDPDETARQVALAFVLEATIPKEGCTSRYADVGPKQRFEWFLVSAVDATPAFRELAARVADAGGQPRTCWDLAYRALAESRRSRAGKLVAYGLVEAMFPAVLARLLADADDGLAALRAVPDVLRASSREDVLAAADMRALVYGESDKAFKRDFAIERGGANLLEHYALHRARCHEASRLFVTELTEGMPLAARCLRFLRDDGRPLPARLADGFAAMRDASSLPWGALADFAAVALFLAISEDPEAPFVRLE